MSGVLAGYRVVDCGGFITGPFTAMLLADLGAEVVKVERPEGGDPFRSFEQGLYGPQFKAFNRNKKSMVLDLSEAGGRELMLRLIDESDVLVENHRPGVMGKLGLNHEALHARNRRLVYCSITGFGPDGPDATRPAYDTVAQAASGYLSLFVSPGDTTIRGPAAADVVTGLYAACGILGALVEREKTGRGRLVEVAMITAMAHFASEPFQHYFTRGVLPSPAHRSHISQSFAFECADRRIIAVHLSSPEKFWRGFVAAIGMGQLPEDPRFATRLQRISNYEVLENELKPVFASHPRDEWIRRLAAHDVPHAPVNTLQEVLDSPQARHLGIEQHAHHPVEGSVRAIASPIVYDRVKPQDSFTAPPSLDEHGPELREWLTSERKPDEQR